MTGAPIGDVDLLSERLLILLPVTLHPDSAIVERELVTWYDQRHFPRRRHRARGVHEDGEPFNVVNKCTAEMCQSKACHPA